jgi:RNA polymerase sigma factor (sigma-70 family)
MARTLMLVSSPKGELADETDEDLLLRMAMKEEDPESARSAFTEFHRRHVGYLIGVCKRYSGVLGGMEGVKDLVEDTLLRVYGGAITFKGCFTKDHDEIRRRVRGWMGKIATNLFIDYRRQDHCKEIPHDPNDLSALLETDKSVQPSDPLSLKQQRVIEEALECLSDRERDVILTTFAFHRVGQDHQRLPNDAAEALANRCSTTSENIRQIRKRAYEKILNYIAQHENKPDQNQP